MPRFNYEYLTEEETQSSDSATWVKDLPKTGVLSGIDLKFEATNGSTSNKDAEIMRVVTKVEVVANGSRVLFSATGQEIARMNWLKLGKFPSSFISENASAVQYHHFLVMFGRFMGDRKFGLDMSKFSSSQLKVTYNLAAVRAVGVTGYTSGTGKITAQMYRSFAGSGIAPAQYLRTTEIDTFTSAASGENLTEVHSRNKLIGIGIYAYESGIADDTDITKVKVDLDNGSRVVFESAWNHLREANAMQFDVDPRMSGVAFKSDTDTIETWTGTWTYGHQENYYTGTVGTTDVSQVRINTVAGGQVTVQALTVEASGTWAANAADTTDAIIVWNAKGIGVGNFAYIPLALEEDLMDALDASRWGNVDLKLTQGGAGATVGIVLEEIENL